MKEQRSSNHQDNLKGGGAKLWNLCDITIDYIPIVIKAAGYYHWDKQIGSEKNDQASYRATQMWKLSYD